MPPSAITDSDMHGALSSFVQAHSGVAGPISYVDEGTFKSIRRMRTLMPCKSAAYGQAALLELRGQWPYPVMMMNDCMPLPPDPPAILLRDSGNGVVVRWRPSSIEEVTRILAKDVFDVENCQRLEAEARAAEERSRAQKKAEEEAAALLKQKQADLALQIQSSISAVSAECEDEIRCLVRKLSSKLILLSFELPDDQKKVGIYRAMEAPVYAAQAVSKEVERRVYLALLQEGAQ